MGYQAGKKLLLKVDFGLGAGFQTVGGIQQRSIDLGGTAVEVTHQESEGNWQEMLAGVGSRGITISGDGVFSGGPVATQLMQAWLNEAGYGYNWQVILPGIGIMEGPFVMTSLKYSGDQKEVVKFSISLSSSGAISLSPDTAAVA